MENAEGRIVMWRSSPGRPEYFRGRHRFEHWYRNNTVYFITARCRERYPAFASDAAKAVFRDRFCYWARWYGFKPWVTTLLENHYHTIGYLSWGPNLGRMMQRIHGSVAKLVNDVLSERRRPFWRDAASGDYFDGCIRNEIQCRRAFRYTLRQSVRHGICRDWHDYPHTRVDIPLERGVRRALELKCFLPMVPYQRYERGRGNSKPAPQVRRPASPADPDFDPSEIPDLPPWDAPDDYTPPRS